MSINLFFIYKESDTIFIREWDFQIISMLQKERIHFIIYCHEAVSIMYIRNAKFLAMAQKLWTT